MFTHLCVCVCQSVAPACLHAYCAINCFLCIIYQGLELKLVSEGWQGCCGSVFCSLRGPRKKPIFFVCQLLLQGRACLLNHQGLACKLSVILLHETESECEAALCASPEAACQTDQLLDICALSVALFSSPPSLLCLCVLSNSPGRLPLSFLLQNINPPPRLML